MATVTQENIAPLNDKLVVNIQKEDYLSGYEKTLKQYAKSANIPGFRKGMVPVGMIKKLHGQGIYTEQVFQAVDKAVNEYIRESKLEIIGQPLPLNQDKLEVDVNNPVDYVFNFEVGLQPEININPADIKVTRYDVEVSDKTLTDEIDNARLKGGEMVSLDVVEDDDSTIKMSVQISDSEGNVAEDTQISDIALFLKDFSNAGKELIKGRKPGDTVIFNISDALASDEVKEKLLRDIDLNAEDNKEANIFLKALISDVELIEKAEMDEDFFKKVFPDKEIKTEEDFKAELKKDIEAYFAGQAQANMQDQIFHQLVDHTSLEFPEVFLKRWLKESAEKPKTDEEVEKEYPDFIKQLKWALISSKLSEVNKIEVQPEEIKEFARRQLLQYMGGQISLDANAEWINDYAEKMMNDRKFIEDAHGQIRIQKLFQVLEGQVTASNEKISEEEFKEKLQGHQH